MLSLSTPPPISKDATYTDAAVSTEAKPITDVTVMTAAPMTPVSPDVIGTGVGTTLTTPDGTPVTPVKTASPTVETIGTTTTTTPAGSASTGTTSTTTATDAAPAADKQKRSVIFYALVLLLIGVVIYGTWWIWSQLKTAPAA